RRRRHTRLVSDWSSDVCSSDLYCAVMVADPWVRPDDVAVTTIVPDAPVDRTMARTLPLKAFRLLSLYEVISTGLPLSIPTSWPRSEERRVGEEERCGGAGVQCA